MSAAVALGPIRELVAEALAVACRCDACPACRVRALAIGVTILCERNACTHEHGLISSLCDDGDCPCGASLAADERVMSHLLGGGWAVADDVLHARGFSTNGEV